MITIRPLVLLFALYFSLNGWCQAPPKSAAMLVGSSHGGELSIDFTLQYPAKPEEFSRVVIAFIDSSGPQILLISKLLQ